MPKQAEYLGYITTSTNALLALIDNILDLATIDAGAMTLELGPVDIRKTIDGRRGRHPGPPRQGSHRAQGRCRPDIGDFIGDESRVEQVLYNLLANAVGFSPQDATISVSAKRTEHNVIFAVTDSGPGIPPDVKDKVFDWFESHPNGSRHRGAGLGLSLVRSFVELHGGKVRVDLIVGTGTTVTCEFPVDQARIATPRNDRAVTFSLALANETATAHLMADLALLIGPGDVITLSGDLGAGKTAAARAMIRYLAGDETLEVPSPTFTLVQGYDLPPFPLLHADLYRVNDAGELEEIGLSPLPEGTVALIEWPERAAGALAADRIDIALSHRPALGSTARAAVITGHGKAAAQVNGSKRCASFSTARAMRKPTPAHAGRRLDALLCASGRAMTALSS